MRLNLGCGPLRHEGEIGVDREPTDGCDVRADLLNLPFRDGCAELVRLDHVLEHLPYRLAVPALMEARRVLVPGGRLHVGVPDVAGTFGAYLDAGSMGEKAHLLRTIYGSQAHAGEYHQSGWDKETLADLLRSVGFDQVEVAEDPERDEGICIKAEAVKV